MSNDENLHKVLRIVAGKVKRYTDGRLNEAGTKASLIEPILNALGWNTVDPEEVEYEFRSNTRDNPVDYALKLRNQPRLFVEAKALGLDLSGRKWVTQVLTYATASGVEWCVLTDGNHYRFYNASAPVVLNEKLFCQVQLDQATAAEATSILKLASRDNLQENHIERLWKEHFVDRRVKKAIEELLAEPTGIVARSVRKRVKGLTPKDVSGSLRRLNIKVNTPGPVLPPISNESSRQRGSTARRSQGKESELAALITAGILKAPTKLFKTYKGCALEATLHRDGTVEFDSVRYRSCSTAAEHAKMKVVGERKSTDGWSFWRFVNAKGRTVPLRWARSAPIRSPQS